MFCATVFLMFACLRYQFRVRARNLVGASPASPVVTFADRDPIPPLPPAIPTPDSLTRRGYPRYVLLCLFVCKGLVVFARLSSAVSFDALLD